MTEAVTCTKCKHQHLLEPTSLEVSVADLETNVSFYNLFNFANFDLPSASLNGLLTGAAGQINGTTPQSHNIDRVGIGTGVYSLGAPIQIEFVYGSSFRDTKRYDNRLRLERLVQKG